MKCKRVFAMMLAGAMLTGMIGCGNNQGGESTGDGTPAEDTTSAFNIYAWGDNHWDIYKEMESEFNESTDYELTYEQDNSLTDFLTTRAASKNLPDMFYVDPYTGVSDWAQGGWLADLSDCDWVDKLPDSVKEAITYDGKIYAYPYSVCYTGFFYNKDIFDKLNLTPPTTVEEFGQVCQKLADAGYIPCEVGGGAGSGWVLYQMFNSLIGAALKDDLGTFVEKMNAGETSYHDIPGIENIEKIMQMALIDYNDPHSMDTDYSSMISKFATGEAAMYHNGSWSVADAKKVTPDINMGVFGYPVSDNPEDAVLTYDVEIAVVESNATGCDSGCKAFYDYLADAETGAAKIATQSRIPVVDVEMSEEDVSHTYSEAMDYINAGKTTGWLNWRVPTGFNDDIAGNIQEYVMGTITFDQLLDKCDEKWASNLG